MGRNGLDCTGSGEGQVAGCCDCGNETWGSIKCLAKDLFGFSGRTLQRTVS